MILSIAAATVLLYLAFPNVFSLQGFSFFAWIFAVPFFYSLEGRNLTGRIKAGFLFGFASNLILVNWMIPYSFPGYLLLSLSLAIQAVIFAVLYKPFWKHQFLNVFYVAAMWVASEYLRKILMFGESWNLAHSQTFNTAVMQAAGVLGSSAISFVLIAFNYAVYFAVQRSENIRSKMNVIMAALVLFVMTFGYGFMTLAKSTLTTGTSVKICVLQTNHDYHGDLSEDRIRFIVEQNIALTREAVATQPTPDLIVWPETSIPTDFLENPELKAKIVILAQETGANFLIGAAIHDEAGQHNSAVLLNSRGEVTQIYHKRHLIPLTEFIPDTLFWEGFAENFKIQTPELVEGSATESGIMKISLRNGKTAQFGVAICSEDNIDRMFSDIRKQGAQFVVVLLNNGWFTQKSGFVMHAQHSMVRAVENHLPVIRSSNAGWSGLIDEFGGSSEESLNSLGETRFFYYEVPVREEVPVGEKKTSNNLGDTFCFLCIAFVILIKIYTSIKERS